MANNPIETKIPCVCIPYFMKPVFCENCRFMVNYKCLLTGDWIPLECGFKNKDCPLIELDFNDPRIKEMITTR